MNIPEQGQIIDGSDLEIKGMRPEGIHVQHRPTQSELIVEALLFHRYKVKEVIGGFEKYHHWHKDNSTD